MDKECELRVRWERFLCILGARHVFLAKVKKIFLLRNNQQEDAATLKHRLRSPKTQVRGGVWPGILS